MSDLKRGLSFCFTWKAKHPHENEPVQSSLFGFGNYQYRLELEAYFSGSKPSSFKLRLQKMQSCPPFRVVCFAEIRNGEAFDVNLRTTSSSEYDLIWSSSRNDIEEYSTYFFENKNSFTFVVFMEDGCHPARDSILVSWPTLELLSSDFNNLLASGDASDAQLKCGDVTRPAHRLVLSARSPVFSAMFRNEMQENATGEVDIGDVDPDLLDIFLEFLYTGKIRETIPDDRYPDLYALGDKYEMNSLKRFCFDSMMERLTKDNFITLLALVERHSDEEFRDRVIESLTDHPDWLNCESWFRFSDTNSRLAIQVYEKVVRKRKL